MQGHQDPHPEGAHPEDQPSKSGDTASSGDTGVDAARGEAVLPKDLKVQIGAQRLIIDWQDGKQSEFALGALRRVCPCAACRTERDQQDANPLVVLKSDPTDVRVTTARLVGNYAIQFFWSDGHQTGIFDFRFLRSLSTGRPVRRS